MGLRGEGEVWVGFWGIVLDGTGLGGWKDGGDRVVGRWGRCVYCGGGQGGG